MGKDREWHMSQKPKIAMLLGSVGGYNALSEVMGNVDMGAAKGGAIYFVEHIKPHRIERGHLDEIGIDYGENKFKDLSQEEFEKLRSFLKENEVRDGTPLVSGKFHYNSGIRWWGPSPSATAIEYDKNTDGIIFRGFDAEKVYSFELFDFNIEKALEAGYGKDMSIIILTGTENDGCRFLGEAKKAGMRIIIQDPKTGFPNGLMRNAIATGEFDHILKPTEIGNAVSEFLL